MESIPTTRKAFEVHSDHRVLTYMVMAEIRTVNRVVMRYILDHQEYNFSLHDIFGKLNFKEDTVSSSLKYEDESNFYPIKYKI